MKDVRQIEWEYCKISVSSASEGKLNKLGSEGWELCCEAGDSLVFKRPKIQI